MQNVPKDLIVALSVGGLQAFQDTWNTGSRDQVCAGTGMKQVEQDEIRLKLKNRSHRVGGGR